MSVELDSVWGLAAAILGGAAVGVERQRSGHATGPNARLGGIRTFTLLGALAGMAGLLISTGGTMVAAMLIAGALAIVVTGYLRASARDIDATTEVAAVVVIGAGVLGGMGNLPVSAALTTLTVLLLAEKPRLHGLVERLDEPTMLAAARFGVMSIVILPLLPEGPFGPGPGIRLRELWMLVLLFSGLSFIGYLAQRIVGHAGYALTGVVGGLVSSTSVTLTFARLSTVQRPAHGALAAGAVAASAVLFLRVLIAVAVLNAALLPDLLRYVEAPLLAAVVAFALVRRSVRDSPTHPQALENPLAFRNAIEMALLFQVVLFGVFYLHEWIGESGVLVSGFLLGLTDVDALTLSMARSASSGTTMALAARAIAIGIVSNSLMKAAIALAIGRGRFRWQTGLSLIAVAAAGAAALAFW